MPFIIKTKFLEPTVPVGSDLYDEAQETRIQILQAINGYLTVEGGLCRSTWWWRAARSSGPSGTTPRSVPPSPTSPSASWPSTSCGGSAPTTASSASAPRTPGTPRDIQVRPSPGRNIRIFGYTVLLNLILRVAMYAISGVVMQGKVPSYAKPTPEELNSTAPSLRPDLHCAVPQGTLHRDRHCGGTALSGRPLPAALSGRLHPGLGEQRDPETSPHAQTQGG
jgi:hypothetical protein